MANPRCKCTLSSHGTSSTQAHTALTWRILDAREQCPHMANPGCKRTLSEHGKSWAQAHAALTWQTLGAGAHCPRMANPRSTHFLLVAEATAGVLGEHLTSGICDLNAELCPAPTAARGSPPVQCRVGAGASLVRLWMSRARLAQRRLVVRRCDRAARAARRIADLAASKSLAKPEQHFNIDGVTLRGAALAATSQRCYGTPPCSPLRLPSLCEDGRSLPSLLRTRARWWRL